MTLSIPATGDRSYSLPEVDEFLVPPSQKALEQIITDVTQFIKSDNFDKVAGPRDVFRKKLEAIEERSNGEQGMAYFYDLPNSPGYVSLYKQLIVDAVERGYISVTTKRVFLDPGTDLMSIIHLLLTIDLSLAREERKDKRQTGADDHRRGDRHIENGLVFLNQQITR
jgi:hypothetical protein